MDGYRWWAEALSQFLRQYKWLLDAHVIEFFSESHWSKLPVSWQISLRRTETAQVSQLLLSSPFAPHRKTVTIDKVYPLSLLAFVATAHTLLVTRQCPQQCGGEAGEKECAVTRSKVLGEVAENHGGSGEAECSTARDRNRSRKVRGKVALQVTGLEHEFRRHVKPKKQHEIKHLAEEVMRMVEVTGCRNIIDVGSGQGHLARYLAYHCGLSVVTVDAACCHLVAAAKYDSEVERDLVKKARNMKIPESTEGTIIHVESTIEPDVSMEDLLSKLGLDSEHSFSLHSAYREPSSHHEPSCHPTAGLASVSDSTFILVGLHTCGDLAPTMLRVYTQSRRVVGLLSVGCCFMKLSCHLREEGGGYLPPTEDLQSSNRNTKRCFTTEPSVVESECTVREGSGCGSSGCGDAGGKSKVWGYPMSDCLSKIHIQLSYEAREVACHSIETYGEKILESSHHVIVHCHRAVVETILRKHGMRRSQVKISKRISRLPFKEYASAVLESLALPPSELERNCDNLVTLLSEWREVATFFMLRLLLAPCVETVLMLDRVLFLRERGFKGQLQAVFDAVLSPRNLLISSHKQ